MNPGPELFLNDPQKGRKEERCVARDVVQAPLLRRSHSPRVLIWREVLILTRFVTILGSALRWGSYWLAALRKDFFWGRRRTRKHFVKTFETHYSVPPFFQGYIFGINKRFRKWCYPWLACLRQSRIGNKGWYKKNNSYVDN